MLEAKNCQIKVNRSNFSGYRPASKMIGHNINSTRRAARRHFRNKQGESFKDKLMILNEQ
jgi:hypothetical protein